MCRGSSPGPCSGQCNKKASNDEYRISISKENDDDRLGAPLLEPVPVPTPTRDENDNSKIPDAIKEARSIGRIALPMVLTGLLLYSRSMVSMLFLGRMGDLALAGGALAVGFANITGYSILSGLAMGMEPICGQAYGAGKRHLLGLALQRTVLLLALASLPIALLWLNMSRALLLLGQDPAIAAQAQSYLLFSLPDLLAQSLIHPLRIYLRAQSVTLPLAACAGISTVLHVPAAWLLSPLGVRGVALAGALANFALAASLAGYVSLSGIHRGAWPGVSRECLRGWGRLLGLAVPSCVSVCLEWWWYEIMILLCGLMAHPAATVASMGVLIQTTALIYIFPSSLAFSVSTRVANELGANRPRRARRAAAVGLGLGLALGLAALAFVLSVRRAWAGMFTADEDILALTSAVLPLIGLCEIGNCPQTAGCGALRGTARPKLAANINLGCFYGVGMPVALGLAFFLGFDFMGLWLGLLAAQLCCAVAMLAALFLTDWDGEAKRAMLLTGTNTNNNHGRGSEDDDNKEVLAVKPELIKGGDVLLYVPLHDDDDEGGDSD